MINFNVAKEMAFDVVQVKGHNMGFRSMDPQSESEMRLCKVDSQGEAVVVFTASKEDNDLRILIEGLRGDRVAHREEHLVDLSQSEDELKKSLISKLCN